MRVTKIPAEFGPHATELSATNVAIIAGCSAAGLILFWPTDLLLAGPDHELLLRFACYRALAAATCLTLAYLITRVPALRRRPAMSLALGTFAAVGVTLVSLGPHTSLDRGWMDLGHLLPLATVALLVPLGRRLALTVALTGGWLALYFGFNPGELTREFLWVHLLVQGLAIGLSVYVGESTLRLIARTHAAATQLELANRGLARRVAEREAELREVYEHIVTAREDERLRLGAELHDATGQVLTGTRLALALMRRAEAPPAAPALAQLDDTLDALFAAIKQLVLDLRPRVLDDLGLLPALAWLATTTSERTAARIRVMVDGEPWSLGLASVEATGPCARLSPTVRVGLFRMAQAALGLFIDRGGVAEASIELRASATEFALRIGADVALDTGSSSPELDELLEVTERARMLGAALTIVRAKPATIEVVVPTGARATTQVPPEGNERAPRPPLGHEAHGAHGAPTRERGPIRWRAWLRGVDPGDAGFTAYCLGLTARNIRRGCVTLAVVLILAWPLDLLVDSEAARGLAGFRVFSVAMAAAIYLAFTRFPSLARRAELAWFAVVVLTLVGCWSNAARATLDLPWIDHTYLIPFVTLLGYQPPRRRLVATAATLGGFLGAYFLMFPAEFGDDAWAFVIVMVIAGLVSVTLGNIIQHLSWRQFRLNRSLDQINDELEQRVAWQTRELEALTKRVARLHAAERQRVAEVLGDRAAALIDRLEAGLVTPALDGQALARERLLGLIAELRESTRMITFNLGPEGELAALDRGELGPRLIRLTSSLRPLTQAALEADIDETLTGLDPPVAWAVYRIVQEALTNAVRHARAGRICVRVARRGPGLSMEVVDDGVGLAPQPVRARGLGLATMRERAEGLGATLRIEPSEPSGTRVGLTLARIERRSAARAPREPARRSSRRPASP